MPNYFRAFDEDSKSAGFVVGISALVRLITAVYPDEAVGDADERLVAFTGAIVPVLNEFLPD